MDDNAGNNFRETMNRPEAIVIAPDWPGSFGGLNIAIAAELIAYREYFPRVHLLVFARDKPRRSPEEALAGIDWHHIPTPASPVWLRFLRSLGKRQPSITLQYRDRLVEAGEALRLISRKAGGDTPPVIIFITLPPGVLIPLAREIFPGSRLVIHSHNVISRSFSGFARRGNLLSRALWGYELGRIRRYERWVAAAVDDFWTISRSDCEAYRRIPGIEVDGVLGVFLDIDRFANLASGDSETIVHVGRIDLRKGRGMHWFIRRVWPIIRQSRPAAKLLLGGKGTEEFTDPARGIRGAGFVGDDREILQQGMIFINPQIDGSGVQLKSIVALLGGRLLVTTITGGAGIAGNHPDHFLASDDPVEMAELILAAVGDPPAARETARRGRALARERYNRENFLREACALFQSMFGNYNEPGRNADETDTAEPQKR